MQGLFQKFNSFFSSRVTTPAEPLHHPEVLEISDTVFSQYSVVIGSVFSYFNDLPPDSQLKFVNRTYQFKASKKFHFVGLENSEDAAILVSASAIQVTFGLKNYMMSYFKDIYILSDAYQIDNEDELYIGHVAPEGIYLSFKHFLYGYSNKNDNVNVAVHEMAHALLYNNFFAQYGTDSHFRLNYEKFSSSTGPILANVITNRRSYLRSYAFSNLHEFWAVSAEAFFENPAGLKSNMPELYEALCRVLNQDPITNHKILKSEP
ncbi:MAG: zinc-dependent peptidase [Bacteroidetes bacterium]|jgi:Mlc titration factor MtfA (ptsG expression regulator)|nr:MAG: zinc-dependent peptidase [Bacteroidota bacterium]